MENTYLESTVLVYAMEQCEADAKIKLREMTKGERQRLRETLSRLDWWIDEVDDEPEGDGTLTVKRV